MPTRVVEVAWTLKKKSQAYTKHVFFIKDRLKTPALEHALDVDVLQIELRGVVDALIRTPAADD
jgi:hypothetical protein